MIGRLSLAALIACDEITRDQGDINDRVFCG
jgi:hypothetical protein